LRDHERERLAPDVGAGRIEAGGIYQARSDRCCIAHAAIVVAGVGSGEIL
jgi:hypothetical protein